MSGHSKWATIKHKKGAVDAKRGKMFTKLIKELTVAARMGGGDLSGNPRLRRAVGDAKGFAMPSDTITRAIKRGTGEIEGAAYEEVLYEGTGPSGTLFLVEGMTDNRNRTVAELRKVFEKNNGVMGQSGTANWAFDRKGVVVVPPEGVTEDMLMDIAVGAGAEDYLAGEEGWQVFVPIESLEQVGKALEGAKLTVKSSGIQFLPKTKKVVSGRDAEVCIQLAEALDDHDDVQNVYTDFDVSDDEMARIAALLPPRNFGFAGTFPLHFGSRPGAPMRVSCGNCSASFIAPDEKIRGRVAKYRCRKCGETIIADGRNFVPDAPDDPTEVMSADALGRADSLSARPPGAASAPPPAVAPIPAAKVPTPMAPRVKSAPPAAAAPRKAVPRDASASFQLSPADVSESPPSARRRPAKSADEPRPAPHGHAGPPKPPPHVEPHKPPHKPPSHGPPPLPRHDEGISHQGEGVPSGLVDLAALAEPAGGKKRKALDNGPPSSGRVNFDALLGAPPEPETPAPALDWSDAPSDAEAAPPRALFPSIAPPGEVVSAVEAETVPLPPVQGDKSRSVTTLRPPASGAPRAVAAKPTSAAPAPATTSRQPVVAYVIGALVLAAGVVFLMRPSAPATPVPATPEATAPAKATTAPVPAPTPEPVVTASAATVAPSASAKVLVDAGPTADAAPPPREDKIARVEPRMDAPEPKPEEPKPEPKDVKPADKADPKPADKDAAKPADKDAAKPADKDPKADAKKDTAPAGDPAEFNKDAARAAMVTAANAAVSCKQEDGPTGPARVRVTFSTSGRSTQAVIDGPPFAGTPVGSCIAQKFRGLSIPAFSGDPVTVTKIVTIM